MMATGTDIIDFGATPTDTATKLVTGLSGLIVDSHLEAFIQSTDSVPGQADAQDHRQLAAVAKCSCEYVSASSMNVNIDLEEGMTIGQYKFHYATA